MQYFRKDFTKGDTGQMLFVRLNMKWDTLAPNQKIIELCNQHFRSRIGLKVQLTPPQRFKV